MKGLKVMWNIRNQQDAPGPCVLSVAPGQLYSTVDQNGNETWRARVQVFGSVAALDKARAKPQPTQGAGATPGSSVPAIEEFDIVDLIDVPGSHPRDLVYGELMKRHADAVEIADDPAAVV